jgi:hypothetical protein
MIALDWIELPHELPETRRPRIAQVKCRRRYENRLDRLVSVYGLRWLHQCAMDRQVPIDRIDQGILVVDRWLVP